jgi:hypothetical protein
MLHQSRHFETSGGFFVSAASFVRAWVCCGAMLIVDANSKGYGS